MKNSRNKPPRNDDCRSGRARAQPEERLARDPARQPDCRDRVVGIGQVEPGVRHDLRGRAAPLHGVALELRPPVRVAGHQAGCGFRVRSLARHFDRAENPHQQSAIDGRDDDRHRQLSEPPLRDGRSAALSAHRRADAERLLEPDPRIDPVSSRRRRNRASGACLQGLRRGAGFRPDRRPEERLSLADRRRQAHRHLRGDGAR